VEVPDDVRLVVARLQDKPEVGETALLRITVPLNPGAKAIVIVDDALDPATSVTLVGLAAMLKAVPTV
jgi:hypothetical protein